jgi:dTDP-4-amino-4,6-dideoxygalactose transaminase
MKHVFLVSSGKAALFLILTALKSIDGRRKVIIPAYTCYSVPSAVVKAGLTVAPCDVTPETLDFDFEKLHDAIDDDALCIISTHLFGIPSDTDRIRKVCEGRGVFLVEDAAQAMGVAIGGNKLGTCGDVAFFSLGRGKNITCGSGGILVTRSDRIASAISRKYSELEREPAMETARNVLEIFLMKIFLHPCLYWIPDNLPFLGIGETRFDAKFGVYRFNGFKAGMLDRCFPKLEQLNQARAVVSAQYLDAMKPGRAMPIHQAGRPYLRFPIYAADAVSKDRTIRRYRNRGVSGMYPDTVNRIRDLKMNPGEGGYPGAERIAKTLVTLPTHSLLKGKDKIALCDLVKSG